MKPALSLTLTLTLTVVMIQSCKKDNQTTVDSYSSVNDFFLKNQLPIQTYTINGSTGGSFTTSQGTVVKIPANAFITEAGAPVIADVTINFKDIYKKSDMLLSNMPTTSVGGAPLKSGGEFFMKATFNNSSIKLANGKKIEVAQPAALTGEDSINIQQPFLWQQDSVGGPPLWGSTVADSIDYIAGNYIFSLYNFSYPVDSGTWCNSDNSTYFSGYPLTLLTLQPNDSVGTYNTQVFLVFKNISSMVHVYYDSINFPYNYAPLGLECTLVVIGVKDGTLYSSFVPLTISANQTVNFSLSQTTTDEFINQLDALN